MSPSQPRRRMDSARPSIPHSERLVIATRAENQSECDEKARNEWLQALDRIESLHPKAVVAGHGVLDPDSSPRHIEETRRYVRDFNACVATTSSRGWAHRQRCLPDRRRREQRRTTRSLGARGGHGIVATFVRTIFAQPDAEEILAFTAFPKEHWRQHRSRRRSHKNAAGDRRAGGRPQKSTLSWPERTSS